MQGEFRLNKMSEVEIAKNWQKAMTGKQTVVLLGNGFDIALGYHTKYIDFYESDEFGKLGNKGDGVSKAYQVGHDATIANW